ncbi:unnamed protein product [Soboliphyme baturini]|uniref:DUF3109 family protein n=1 Tax=Soboliphyme baturini TaxID=241478 RepID=A0A183IJH1_9BILA|nr:unnamed protein product [Soboliphyme baturini]
MQCRQLCRTPFMAKGPLCDPKLFRLAATKIKSLGSEIYDALFKKVIMLFLVFQRRDVVHGIDEFSAESQQERLGDDGAPLLCVETDFAAELPQLSGILTDPMVFRDRERAMFVNLFAFQSWIESAALLLKVCDRRYRYRMDFDEVVRAIPD